MWHEEDAQKAAREEREKNPRLANLLVRRLLSLRWRMGGGEEKKLPEKKKKEEQVEAGLVDCS